MVAWGDLVIKFLVWVSLIISASAGTVALLATWNRACPSRSLKWRLLPTKAEQYAKSIEVCLAAAVASAALFALLVYKETNTLSMLEALEERDRANRALYVSADASNEGAKKLGWQGKDLLKIFADQPQRFLKGKWQDLSDDEYRQCTLGTKKTIKKWAEITFNTAAHVQIGWTDINDLYPKVWGSRSVLDERTELARVLVMHAIDYLYIVHDAMRERQKGYFTSNETAMWGAYLNDLTPSPFFLLALRDGTKFQYMMPEVADDIRAYYKSPDQFANKCVIDALYPAFWTEKPE